MGSREKASRGNSLLLGHVTDLQRSFLGLFRTLLFHILRANQATISYLLTTNDSTRFGPLKSWTLEEFSQCFERLS